MKAEMKRQIDHERILLKMVGSEVHIVTSHRSSDVIGVLASGGARADLGGEYRWHVGASDTGARIYFMTSHVTSIATPGGPPIIGIRFSTVSTAPGPTVMVSGPGVEVFPDFTCPDCGVTGDAIAAPGETKHMCLACMEVE